MKLSRPTSNSGFTMVEIAMALAIIGFALVAIIGTLPMGMEVQKNNRRETIINQDANYFIDALRGGARGLDDLTNYVAAITIVSNNLVSGAVGTASYANPNPIFSSFPLPNPLVNPQTLQLTSGERIIGLLSTPKYTGNNYNWSNYVVAYVKAISGAAIEKAPQNNKTINEAAFGYRLVTEIVPYGATTNTYFDSTWKNGNDGYARVVTNLNANLHDVRLLFRWPLLPGLENGLPKIGNGRQVYRLMVGGSQASFVTNSVTGLYFFQPQMFTTNAP